MDYHPVEDDQNVADWAPERVWKELEVNDGACLIDVRSKPEWIFVGVPDLSSIGRRVVFSEWISYPETRANPSFVEQVTHELGSHSLNTFFFICRSGVRSRAAAIEVSKSHAKAVQCVNVAEGFEGDLDHHRRRGYVNGWKFKKLPWRQT